MASQPIKFTSISPIVAVQALDLDLEYYIEQLEFSVTWRWGNPQLLSRVKMGERPVPIQRMAVLKSMLTSWYGVWSRGSRKLRMMRRGGTCWEPVIWP